jgi:hypothetical protein
MCALRQTLLSSDLEFLFSICDVFQHKLWPICSLLVTALITIPGTNLGSRSHLDNVKPLDISSR